MSAYDDGFTLAEVLVALVVVSLTIAGLLQAAGLAAHGQSDRAEARQVQRHVTQMVQQDSARLNGTSPLLVAKMTGDAAGLSYPCDAGDCRVEANRFAPDARFVYASGSAVATQWPVEATEGARPSRLEAVIVENAQGLTLGRIALRTEQPLECQFDSLTRQCREDEQP